MANAPADGHRQRGGVAAAAARRGQRERDGEAAGVPEETGPGQGRLERFPAFCDHSVQDGQRGLVGTVLPLLQGQQDTDRRTPKEENQLDL